MKYSHIRIWLASFVKTLGIWCVLALALGGFSQQAHAQSNAALVAQTVPATMLAGRSYTVSVTMKNVGTTTWTDGAKYRLGSQAPQDNVIWGIGRILLGGTVIPGQEYTFTFEVRAPAVAGAYAFQWQMVQEAVAWFGPMTNNVPVQVTSVPSIAAWTAAVTPLPTPPTSITRVNSFEYDAATGLLVKQIVEPDEPQLRVETEYPIAAYDTYGNLKSGTVSSPATGTAAIVTRGASASFDSRGRFLESSTNALGQVASYGFDARFGTPTSAKDANLISASAEYDNFGRKTRLVAADGTITKWSYQYCTGVNGGTAACPPLGKYLVEMTSLAPNGVTANGPTNKVFYDMIDRPVEATTLGFDGTSVIKTTTTYDLLGRVYQVSRPFFADTQTAILTTFYYDELGRVTSSVRPGGKTTTFGYSGLTKTTTNALSQTRTQITDAIGRVASVLDAAEAKNSLTYQYDPFDNLTSTTDSKQNVVSIAYNKRGHKLQMVDPDMGAWTYENDVLGEMVQEKNAKQQTSTMVYDKLGRLTSRAEPDLKSTWIFDACTKGIGKLCSKTADNGYASSNVYDALGRLQAVTTSIAGDHVSSFTYDANGRLDTQTYPTGFAVKYGYTALGYLATMRNNASNVLYWTALQRDAEGQMSLQKYGNNVVTQQVFDPNTGELNNVYAGAGNAVQDLTFTYDDAGNLKLRSDKNQNLSETFLYDALQRVKSSTVNAPGASLLTQSYDYDSIGNIKSRSDVGVYSAGVLNARPHGIDNIALVGGSTRYFEYDANGNMKYQLELDAAKNLNAAKSRCTSYTSYNMPKKMASPTAAVAFNYGPNHERIKMIAPGTTTIFVHPDNAGSLMYEKDFRADQTVEHRFFIAAGGQIVALVKKDNSGTTTVNYMHQDQLGSVTAITNETGVVVERLAYEPFGKRRYPAGAQDQSGQIKGSLTDRGFTSHEHIDSLGLVNMNGRVYDPAVGRFLSADPTVPNPDDLQSFNRYAYTRNNPLNAVDMDGFADTKSVVYTGNPAYGTDWSTTYGTTTTTTTFVTIPTFFPGGAGMDFWTWATMGSQGNNSGGGNAIPQGAKWTASPVQSGSGGQRLFTKEMLRASYSTIAWGRTQGEIDDAQHESYLFARGLVPGSGLVEGYEKINEGGAKNVALGVGMMSLELVRPLKVVGKEITATYKGLNQARAAARKSARLGEDAIDFVQEIGPFKGQVTGRMSPDKLRGWRLDFDPEKGYHVNWWDHSGGPKRKDWIYGANTIEGGTLDDFYQLLQHFPKK